MPKQEVTIQRWGGAKEVNLEPAEIVMIMVRSEGCLSWGVGVCAKCNQVDQEWGPVDLSVFFHH